MATERRVIVDTDSTATRDYASLAAAIVGEEKDLVALNRKLVIECRASSGAADTANVTDITGFTTSADCTLTVEVHPEHRHSGAWDETKYRISTPSGYNAVKIINDHVILDGLQVENAETSHHTTINFDGTTPSKHVVIKNCIVNDPVGDAGTSHRVGINCREGSEALVQNCIAIGFNSSGSNSQHTSGFFTFGHDNGLVKYQNCTAYGCRHGFLQNGGVAATILVENCMALDSVVADFFNAMSTASRNNISTDDTAPGTGSLINQVTTDLVVDAAGGDFRLKAGSNAIDAGANLSADFNLDLRGGLRGATFDVGAFEFCSLVHLTELKEGNQYDKLIPAVHGIRVKLWVGDSTTAPSDTGAEDFLTYAASIINGEMKLYADIDAGDIVVGEALWVDGTDRLLFLFEKAAEAEA